MKLVKLATSALGGQTRSNDTSADLSNDPGGSPEPWVSSAYSWTGSVQVNRPYAANGLNQLIGQNRPALTIEPALAICPINCRNAIIDARCGGLPWHGCVMTKPGTCRAPLLALKPACQVHQALGIERRLDRTLMEHPFGRVPLACAVTTFVYKWLYRHRASVKALKRIENPVLVSAGS